MSYGQRIEIPVAIPDDADGGDLVQAYWDAFTGVVDYDAPLLPAPLPLLPGKLRSRGWGESPWGAGDLVGRANRFGLWGVQRWGLDPWGAPPAYAVVAIHAPRGYGVATFGIEITGPTGNSVGSPLEVPMVVATESPVHVGEQTLAGYDSMTDRAAFEATLIAE